MFNRISRIALVAATSLAASLMVAPVASAATPALNITNAKVWQKSSTGVYTTGKVVLKVKKSGPRKNSVIKLNPIGAASSTGKTQRKAVKLKWSSARKAYVGTYKFSSKAPGKISVTAYANGRTFKRTKSHGKESTGLSGVATTSVTKAAYATVSDSLRVSNSARGRTLLVQYKSGSSWKTYKKYTLSKRSRTANKTISMKAPAAGKSLKYRVYVPATKFAKQSKVYYRTVVAKKATTPTPTPTPSPTTPGLNCGVDLLDVVLPCESTLTYANAMDVASVNLDCGITRDCLRHESAAEAAEFGSTPNDLFWMTASNPTASSYPLAAPKLVEQVNQYRSTKGLAPLRTFPAFDNSVTNGISTPGQGGYAQTWAEQMAADGSTSHSAGNSMTRPLAVWLNENYPDARPGVIWTCGENVGASSGHSSQAIVSAWSKSSTHVGLLTNNALGFMFFGAAQYDMANYVTMNVCRTDLDGVVFDWQPAR